MESYDKSCVFFVGTKIFEEKKKTLTLFCWHFFFRRIFFFFWLALNDQISYKNGKKNDYF